LSITASPTINPAMTSPADADARMPSSRDVQTSTAAVSELPPTPKRGNSVIAKRRVLEPFQWESGFPSRFYQDAIFAGTGRQGNAAPDGRERLKYLWHADGDTYQFVLHLLAPCVLHHPASCNSRSRTIGAATFGFTRIIEMPAMRSQQMIANPLMSFM